MENFSLLKTIAAVANNQQIDERAQEVINEGIAEMRKSGQSYGGQIVLPVEERSAILAGTATQGQENVPEDKLNILEPLRAKMVLGQAGATYMTGLVGDISIPVYAGSTVTWKGEVAAAGDGGGAFSEVTLSPKRLTAYVDVSKQFLIQDSNSAEEMLRNDILEAIAHKLEATILGSEAGSSTQPAGIFYGESANVADVTFADMVNLEATLDASNIGGNLAYIVSPTAKATLRTVSKDSGSGQFIMANGEIEGLPVYSTSAVYDTTNSAAWKGVALANWSDLLICQWGGIDLTVDPYTQAANGKVRIVVNAYFDAKFRRAKNTSYVVDVLK